MIMPLNVCRKCVQCQDSSHHWIYGIELDADDLDDAELDEIDFDALPDWQCKHCDQQGRTCPDCVGEGSPEDGGDEDCPTCNGEGVVLYL